jgi:WD40 repeat protein
MGSKPLLLLLLLCGHPVPQQVRIELYDRKQTKFISAHNTPLVCLTLSMDGKRLATASDKGTLVRVWNTADGQLLQVGVGGGRLDASGALLLPQACKLDGVEACRDPACIEAPLSVVQSALLVAEIQQLTPQHCCVDAGNIHYLSSWVENQKGCHSEGTICPSQCVHVCVCVTGAAAWH